MLYKAALWNGSDPLYAPGLSWSGRDPNNKHAHWKCPKKYLKAGYITKSVNLDLPGSKEDLHQTTRALKCRQLTQELLRWWDGLDTPSIDPDTWHYLIARYKSDEFSPIQEVKANTRVGYVEQLSKLEQAIGHMKVEDLDYVEIKKTQKAMQEKGRSTTYIHRFFNTLRRVARYGKALKLKPAAEVASVLAEMRFPTGAARQIAPTREQVYKIVAAADANGRDYFALGILIQYEFSLRAVDVRGHWLVTNEQEGGIIRNGKRWQDGLTWDMFDTELTQFKKVISKTIKSLPEPYTFDLTLVPEIQSRLQKIRPKNPVGPVIIATRSDSLPYTRSGWTRAWAKMREDAKVPKDIWLMDLRAGGVTEAKSLGADPYALRDAAQHLNTATTDRYSRDRSGGANKIVQLRQAK